MFPFVIAGKIATPLRTQSEIDLFVDRLAVELRAHGIAPEVTRSEISFLNNRNIFHFFRPLPWALFGGVDSGTFEIHETDIHYKLSNHLGLVVPLTMFSIVFALTLAVRSVPLVSFVLVLLLLMGVRYATLNTRLRRMLRRVADHP